jgi:dipeptidase
MSGPQVESERWRLSCDSLVALANATADGSVLFAKNSDRPANECQPLVQLPRARYASGSLLRCQYIEIPQVSETARVIGSRPFWLWGFEHGVNEHGVAIGNHTVFTRDPLGKSGLIGMDLVRLGLERAATAAQAVEVITSLVEHYGQGGSGYFDKDWPYHNSFLIVDGEEAYVLETSDRRWAVRRVETTASMSNHLSIGSNWDALSPGTIEHAIENGWWSEREDRRFDFSSAYRDTSVAPDVISSGRHKRTCELLDQAGGRITIEFLMTALRDHYDGLAHKPGRSPDDERYFSVCMHADPVGTTTASIVARLPKEKDEIIRCWASLGSPCVSVFLPYYIDGEVPEILSHGGEHANSDSPWWRFKELLTLVERNFERYGPLVRAYWDQWERDVRTKATEVESEALRSRRNGVPTTAAKLLTDFMAANVAETLKRLEKIIQDIHSS